MNGAEYSDGEPAGWWCDACIAEWVKTGVPPGDSEADDD
jgi:hypothetical protein